MADAINLIFKLDGKDLEKGLSAPDVSSILNSLNNLVQESSKTLNPIGPSIDIKVKPFQEGSFVFDLVLGFLQTAQATISPTGSEGIKQLIETLKLVGIIAGEEMDVLSLLKKLKGKPKKVVESQGGNFNYLSQDDETIEVKGDVHNLLQNPNITNNISNTYYLPFNDENVEKINGYIKDDEENTRTEVKQEEAQNIDKFTSPEIKPIEPRTIEQDLIVLLHPKRVDIEGDGSKWSFREAGGDVIQASIKDKIFLENIALGKIRLTQSDTLEVKLHKTQKINENGSESMTNDILEVLDYSKGVEGSGQSSFL